MRAPRGEEKSLWSNRVAAGADPADLATANLTARFTDGVGVSLSWNAPASDAGSVTGYEVLRRMPSHVNTLSVLVADTQSTETAYTVKLMKSPS